MSKSSPESLRGGMFGGVERSANYVGFGALYWQKQRRLKLSQKRPLPDGSAEISCPYEAPRRCPDPVEFLKPDTQN